MIHAVLQRITFSRFALHQWREASLLHRLLAPLRRWRQGSWLLPYGDAIAAIFIALILMLAPYVSTTLIGVLMLICAAFWLLLTVSDTAEGWLTPIHIGVALYWGVMVVATALSPVKAAAVSGLIKLTLNILLFLLMARVMRHPRLRTGVISAFLLTTLIVSVYGLRQWFFGAEALATWVDPESNLSGTTRVYSYLGNPNLLAAYLIPAVTFSAGAIFIWPRWLPKVLAVVALLVNTACLILTLSRGGWLGFLAASFALMVLLIYWWSELFPPFWRRWALPLLLGGSAAVIVLSVLFVPPVQERVMSMFAGRADSSNNFRINVWEAVTDMIRDRPVIGIGPGNEAFNLIYPLYQRPNYTALSAYSIFLETLVEAGAIGFTCFLWMIATAFYQGYRQLQRLRATLNPQAYWLIGAIAAMVGTLVHGIVDTVWYRPQVSTLWWLCMAVIASFYVTWQEKFRANAEAIGEVS
ncbi:MAG: putative bicarbonate transporter, IctB family [Leptolyngbya sp. SIO4C1]|nr:putative bicarbonate transporter, IctB family [Leptolyngbya sp. SIO4C1]